MKVLVCGGRDWQDREIVDTVLNGFEILNFGDVTVIEGEARGADTFGREWAERNGHPYLPFPAYWRSDAGYNRGAGPQRNQRMLTEGQPDLVVAFKDGFDFGLGRGGTEDMVRRAKAAGVRCYVISHP